MPKARAFHKVLEMIDLDFGMNFDKRAINSTNIDVKSISFIQKNKKEGLLTTKRMLLNLCMRVKFTLIFSRKPNFEVGYGKNIDCGNAVSLGKNFLLKGLQSENRIESMENFVQVFYDIEETLRKSAYGKFPILHLTIEQFLCS